MDEGSHAMGSGNGGDLRLAIVNLTAGGLSGGYRSYLRHLVPHLSVHRSVSALSVLVPPTGVSEGSGGGVFAAWPQEMWRHPSPWIRQRLEIFHPDVVFVPTARGFRYRDVPSLVMVRNMEPLVRPMRGNPILEGLRNLARREAARRACRRADRILAVSGFVRDFLVERWGIPERRIGVVYHGVSAEDSAESAPRVLAKDPAPFIFTAGSIRPARGLEDLLSAFPLLLAKFPGLRLAIAGTADPGSVRYAAKLHARLAPPVAANICWLGTLSSSEMAWCFRHAVLFVMTSRVEACPNTVLEAMAYGTPSLSTTSRPMPEFFREAASYYPEGDHEALASNAIRLLTMTPGEAGEIRQLAARRVADFDWQRTADRTVAELRLALDVSPRRERD